MTDAGILAGVLDTLAAIAPEVAGGELVADRALRQQVDLDSMDWLNFLIGLHQRFGVDIPEADYAKLVDLRTIVDYLAARSAKPAG
ncbi:MAG: acyl carrier protein [Burkholderiaceae bacterium]|nr:acyl carrier protein [Burkholderiaceae bacterium]